MAEGEVWVFDTWQRHRVDNPASSPRIHLVIDAVGSAPMWDLVERPDREPRRLGDDDDADSTATAPELPVEQWNWPVVMAPAEVDTTVELLLGDLRAVDDDARRPRRGAPRAVPSRLARPHRALRPRTRGLAAAARARSKPRAAACTAELAGCTARQRGRAHARARPTRVQPRAHARASRGRAAPRRPRHRAAHAARASRPSLLDGPPRIVDPVFIVCPPRSGIEPAVRDAAALTQPRHHRRREPRGDRGHRRALPAAHDWDSNRLDATDATDGVVAHLKERFAARHAQPRGAAVPRPDPPAREDTRRTRCASRSSPQAFPDARFVFLYRDPRETVSSMLDAWRSEKFVTYRDLPGWDGPPWSLLLTPGWRDLADRPLGDVVSRAVGRHRRRPAPRPHRARRRPVVRGVVRPARGRPAAPRSSACARSSTSTGTTTSPSRSRTRATPSTRRTPTSGAATPTSSHRSSTPSSRRPRTRARRVRERAAHRSGPHRRLRRSTPRRRAGRATPPRRGDDGLGGTRAGGDCRRRWSRRSRSCSVPSTAARSARCSRASGRRSSSPPTRRDGS